jgi:GntR family transcriptional regulator/MocR family aminotransferase
VRLAPEQILVTAGSQQSLDMITRLLLDEGDFAAVEQPCYDGAISALRAAGAQLIPVPVDEEGLDPSAADSIESARLIYTTPSHQYPLGVTLTLQRRLTLLQWAERNDSWIIEDDYDSEFRYDSRPLPSLQGLTKQQRVLYVGTFSKVLASALRIGFIVLPEELVEPFVRARQVIDHHPPLSIQAPLAEFIAGGHLERHIGRMRGVYAERRNVLRHALEETFGEACPVVPGYGGLHLTMLLPDEVDDVAVAKRAFSRGIDPQPLSAHYVSGQPRRGLVLGFGAFPPDMLRKAVATLEGCLKEEVQASRKGSHRLRGG